MNMYRWLNLELKKIIKGEEYREYIVWVIKIRIGMIKDVRLFGVKNCRFR